MEKKQQRGTGQPVLSDSVNEKQSFNKTCLLVITSVFCQQDHMKKYPFHPLWVVLCLFHAWVLYQRLGSLRVLHWILSIPRIMLFWTEISGIIPGFL